MTIDGGEFYGRISAKEAIGWLNIRGGEKAVQLRDAVFHAEQPTSDLFQTRKLRGNKMPSQIHPAVEGEATGEVIYTARYEQAPGVAGEVQSPPEFTLSDPVLADLVVVPSTEKGVFQAKVKHNGGVGEVTITCGQVDGDLGAGDFPIGPFTDPITLMPPAGATAGVFSAGTETAPTA